MTNEVIRDETPADVHSIEQVIRAAFLERQYSSHTEQFIVAALRKASALFISLVVEIERTIVGHVALSPVTISSGAPGWYGLGPISVVPGLQGRGVGSRLMREALRRLQASDAAGCVLLGNPRFYARFGFKPEPGLSLANYPPEFFQALSFRPDVPHGLVSYHAAFDAKSCDG